jgi:hypothetical protein
MKSWKIFTAVSLAVVVAALFTASAYAYMGSRAVSGIYGSTATGVAGTYGYYGGMIGGGMMGGYGYAYNYPPASTYTTPTTTTQPSTTSTTTYPHYCGGMGCGAIGAVNGYIR